MARSRRYYRRSTSQRAVGLLTSALPYPIQRIADTQLGSSVLLIGIPALIIAGVLHFDWEGGVPHLSIDHNRATEIRNAAHEELSRINVGPIQQLHQTAHELWDSTLGQYSGYGTPQPYPQQPGFPAQPQPYYQQPQPQNYPQQTYPQPNYPQQSYQPQTYQPQTYQAPANGLWR